MDAHDPEPIPCLADILRAETARARTAFPARAAVTCQGTAGAYSEQAARRLFAEPDIRFVAAFDDVFRAVERGETPYGVLPIENSTAGSVAAVYDLMRSHRFRIVRAARLRIDHALLGASGATEDGIREVVSHPQALAQCSRYFERRPDVRATPVSNTAVAARMVSEGGRRDLAALASPECAALYGLEVLRESVADVAAATSSTASSWTSKRRPTTRASRASSRTSPPRPTCSRSSTSAPTRSCGSSDGVAHGKGPCCLSVNRSRPWWLSGR